MVALSNTTNFELPCRHAAYNMTAGPSCQPASRQSPQYEADMGQGKAYEEEDDDEESELMLAKRQECARRVSAWINQSAVRITAIASPYDSSTTSFDLLDLDLDLEGELYESNFRYIPEGEPYLLYSSSCHKSSGTPVVHAPTPRRSSRGRSGRRHGHGHSHRRIPSPLYVIHEEDSE